MLVDESLHEPGGKLFRIFEGLGEHKAPFLLTFPVNSPDCRVSGAVIVKNSCHNHLPFLKILGNITSERLIHMRCCTTPSFP
jgi:hypothetical protein